jgi:hypothetical protein
MGILKLRKQNGNAKPAPQPSAEDPDAVAAEEKAKDATAPAAEEVSQSQPLSTPPTEPQTVEQPSVPGFAPGGMIAPASFLPANDNTDWTDPKLDTTKKDSLGNEKTDVGEFGPKGSAPPPDVQTDAQRQASADAKEARMREHMGSTVAIDSLGQQKGRFAVIPQGHDSHGMRLPDKVDRSTVVEEQPPHVGPRGQGAPADTFHGARPAKKN